MTVFEMISQKRFVNRVNCEIRNKIFPHLRGDANHGYPFGSDRELLKQGINCELDVKLHIEQIAELTAQNPKAYGDALRFIAYRDLDEQAKMFLMLARREVRPEVCDPPLIAVHA